MLWHVRYHAGQTFLVQAPPCLCSLYLLVLHCTQQPTLSLQILVSYYQLQRQAALGSLARTTIRMLESLVRIAQAHAKLMARNTVTQQVRVRNAYKNGCSA